MGRTKILFLYPNHKGMTMLPPGISLLSAVLKREGFVVDLFDTTQYDSVEIDGEKEAIDTFYIKSSELNQIKIYLIILTVAILIVGVLISFELRKLGKRKRLT